MFAELFIPEGKTRDDLTGAAKFFSHPAVATGIMVIIGCGMGFMGLSQIWGVFGAANQLLAGIAMLAVAAWLGNIGRNLVKRLQGFEPILLGYDHFLARQRALNIGVTPTSIEDIFSQCDIITLHVPGGPSTHHMVNAELIGKMKDGAVLINCSRYGVVDEEALAAAKAAGRSMDGNDDKAFVDEFLSEVGEQA